jgi:hypothetical protein
VRPFWITLALVPAGLLCGVALGACGAPDTMSSRTDDTKASEPAQGDAEARLEALWRKVELQLPTAPPPFLWQRHRTPPLPLAWPPDARTPWVRHAYAYGFDPRTSDGIRVAAPYARLTLDREGRAVAAEATPPSAGRLELGIQGVFPTHPPSGAIDPEEIARFERTALALTGLPSPGSGEEAALLAFYGRWLEREGVIANAVRKAHIAFFTWLEARRGSGRSPAS